MVKVDCQLCKKSFGAKPSWIKNGYGKYCSRNCAQKALRLGKEVPCSICGQSTYKQRKALDKSKSGKLFCSKSCQTKWRNTQFIEDKHPNWKGGTHAYRRMMQQSKIPSVCRLCKTNDARVIAVHHIDENRKNNTIENLAWLCHNCHHLVHHYQAERRKFMATMV